MPSNARGERRERRVFQLIYDIQLGEATVSIFPKDDLETGDTPKEGEEVVAVIQGSRAIKSAGPS